MKVTIQYECGDKTCAISKGTFCRFLGVKNLGSTYVCLLYRGDEGDEVKLFNEDGWLQRCDQCLANDELGMDQVHSVISELIGPIIESRDAAKKAHEDLSNVSIRLFRLAQAVDPGKEDRKD